MYNFTIRHRVDSDPNILNPEALIQGYSWANDDESEDSSSAYTDMIAISPVRTYQGNGASGTDIIKNVSFYDFNKRYLSDLNGGGTSSPTGVFEDNFNDGAVNGLLWSETNNHSPERQITESGGKLRLITDGTDNGDPFNCRLESIQTITTGAIQCALQFVSNPVNYGFGLWIDSSNHAVIQGAGSGSNYRCRIVVGGSAVYNVNSSVPGGDEQPVRITVNGSNQINFQYWDGSAWVNIVPTQTQNIGSAKKAVFYTAGGNGSASELTADSFYMDTNTSYTTSTPAGDEEPAENVSTFDSPSGAYYAIITVKSTSGGEPDPYLMSITEGVDTEYSEYFRSRQVNPSYKKLDRKIDKESGYQFYREKIDGNMKLLREDYDYLAAFDFDQEIFIDIEDPDNFFNKYTGVFYKTDCKWDADNRAVELKFDTDDNYTDLLGGLDKTFNLVEEAPELQELVLRKRPIIQVYIPGDKVVTNILGGAYWEQEIQVDPVFDHSTLVNTYKFFNTQNIRSISTGYAPFLSTDVTGEYDTNGDSNNGLYTLITETDTVYISFVRYRYIIRRISDSADLYQTGWSNWRDTSINTLVFNGINGETGSFYFTDYRIYTRYYTDLLDVRGTGTYPVPETDIVPNNSNYKRIIGYDMGTTQFAVYNQFVDYPTKFGRVPGDAPNAQQYYKEFLVSVTTGLSNPVPVSSSSWKAVSLWFFTDLDIRYTEFIDGQDFELRDSYPIHSVIQTLLRAIGSNLTFKNTTDFSEILYSETNPLGGFTFLDFDGGTLLNDYSGNLNLFITPKSNILIGDYDHPAQRAEITLNQVLKMLREVFKLEWHVEGNRLRIEHVSWYQKGGSYGTTIVGSDLTLLKQPRNQKSWGFNQNKWEFDKEDMPERFEYGWADDVSFAFEGFPIQIENNHVQKGRIEDKNVAGFTSDIDFLMANPQEASKDGFALIGAINDAGFYRIPYIEYNIGFNSEVIMQNGFLSWLYLHPKFHVYDLPSDNVNINNTSTTLFSNITKKKKQEVTYPATGNINPYQLVKTDLGNGIIDKMTVNMESRMIKATIKHDTE